MLLGLPERWKILVLTEATKAIAQVKQEEYYCIPYLLYLFSFLLRV
jgi:hypothetical protein